jgi:ABC-2 type transport system permease protein
MNTFPTLLKREFWEHKGGMLWAPVIVGGIMGLFAAGSMIFGAVMARDNMVGFNGVRLTNLGDAIPADKYAEVAAAMSFSYLPALLPFLAILTFVVLFYSLGSLYDDRRDRSLLFWKSMPVSDASSVLAKLASILLITPTLSLALGSIFGFGLVMMSVVTAAILGANLFAPVLSSSNIYLMPFGILSMVPVYALWALPSVAWFMLVSAWAKRAPFLWAVGVPVLAGIILSWAEAMFKAGLPHEWFWENVIGRLFGSIVPGLFFLYGNTEALERQANLIDANGPQAFELGQWVLAGYQTLATPTVWIGLVLGAAMIVAAIRLRRWREDAA